MGDEMKRGDVSAFVELSKVAFAHLSFCPAVKILNSILYMFSLVHTNLWLFDFVLAQKTTGIHRRPTIVVGRSMAATESTPLAGNSDPWLRHNINGEVFGGAVEKS